MGLRKGMRFAGTRALAALALVACGDGAAAPGLDGTMVAHVLPTLLWVAERSLTATRAGADLVITGEDYRERRVTLALHELEPDPSNPDAPRTLSLNDSTDVTVGYAQYRESAVNLFTTTELGARGTVTITHLSPTRVSGTFSFIARRPSEGIGVDLNRTVSNGEFDVRIR